MKLTIALNKFLQQNANRDQNFFFCHGCPLNKESLAEEIIFWKLGTAAIAVLSEVQATAIPLFVLGATKSKKVLHIHHDKKPNQCFRS